MPESDTREVSLWQVLAIIGVPTLVSFIGYMDLRQQINQIKISSKAFVSAVAPMRAISSDIDSLKEQRFDTWKALTTDMHTITLSIQRLEKGLADHNKGFEAHREKTDKPKK